MSGLTEEVNRPGVAGSGLNGRLGSRRSLGDSPAFLNVGEYFAITVSALIAEPRDNRDHWQPPRVEELCGQPKGMVTSINECNVEVIKQGDELHSIDRKSGLLFCSFNAIDLPPQRFSPFGF